jgi:hypothetical protein
MIKRSLRQIQNNLALIKFLHNNSQKIVKIQFGNHQMILILFYILYNPLNQIQNYSFHMDQELISFY